MIDRFRHAANGISDLGPLHRPKLTPRLFEIRDRRGEGNQPLAFLSLADTDFVLSLLMGQIVLEQEVIDFAILAELIEIQLREPVEPLGVKLMSLLIAPPAIPGAGCPAEWRGR